MAFTEEDEGTTVHASDGRAIGVVDEVVDGTAFVQPVPDLAGPVRAALGWGGDARDTYRLDPGRVKYVSGAEIRLEDP